MLIQLSLEDHFKEEIIVELICVYNLRCIII